MQGAKMISHSRPPGPPPTNTGQQHVKKYPPPTKNATESVAPIARSVLRHLSEKRMPSRATKRHRTACVPITKGTAKRKSGAKKIAGTYTISGKSSTQRAAYRLPSSFPTTISQGESEVHNSETHV